MAASGDEAARGAEDFGEDDGLALRITVGQKVLQFRAAASGGGFFLHGGKSRGESCRFFVRTPDGGRLPARCPDFRTALR